MPRIYAYVTGDCEFGLITRLGTDHCRSVMSLTPRNCSCSASYAVNAIGVSCADVSRFSAVTMISSIASPSAANEGVDARPVKATDRTAMPRKRLHAFDIELSPERRPPPHPENYRASNKI